MHWNLLHRLLMAAAVSCSFASPASFAAAAADTPAVSIEVVTERIKALNPGTRIDSVSLSPIEGLYEVVMGKNIAYVEPSGRFALFGHVWDMQQRRDLTADRKADLDKVDVALLPRDLAVRHVRGKGTRVLYVFADPQCGYCKQLEQALQELDDVTVYTFVMPLLGQESKRLAGAVACAASPAAAWSKLMLKAQVPADAGTKCDAHTEAVANLAQKLGVSGTPTLIAGDGRKTAGAMGGAQLNAWLGAGPPVSVAAGSAVGGAQGGVQGGGAVAAVRPSSKTAPR